MMECNRATSQDAGNAPDVPSSDNADERIELACRIGMKDQGADTPPPDTMPLAMAAHELVQAMMRGDDFKDKLDAYDDAFEDYWSKTVRKWKKMWKN